MAAICFGRQQSQQDDQIDEVCFGNTSMFSYASLQAATNFFSDKIVIGGEPSGKDYRGFLPDGTLITVKTYEHARRRDFENALVVMSSIRHRNIHQFLGYCSQKNQKSYLVTEYMDNGNLHDLIHNNGEKSESVFNNWRMRVAVCIGIATGCSYLHEDANPHVIHHGITPRSILLDKNFTPKITKFEISRCFRDYDELPLEEPVRGCIGFIDPEYLRTGTLTEKSDVFSFGVVMLEIISGRKAFNRESENYDMFLKDWALYLKRNGRVLEMVDPVLTDFPVNDVQRFIDVACLCIREESKLRPSMREVTQQLQELLNSRMQSLRSLDMPTTDDASSITYFSAASSFRSSISETNIEDEGEDSILEGERNVDFMEIQGMAPVNMIIQSNLGRSTAKSTSEPETSSSVNHPKFDPTNLYRSKNPGVKRFLGARV